MKGFGAEKQKPADVFLKYTKNKELVVTYYGYMSIKALSIIEKKLDTEIWHCYTRRKAKGHDGP